MAGPAGDKDYLDYRDTLWLQGAQGQELQQRLGLDPEVLAEERQCVLLSTTAAVLWARQKEPPTMEAVQERALEERLHVWEQAA